MTLVKIYPDKDPKQCQTLENISEIQKALAEINIGVKRWTPQSKLSLEASQEEILAAYADQVKTVMQDHGFSSVDVISMNSSTPADKITALRKKFLDEHIHSDDEVRYFIEGSGLFCIHANEHVYQILCKAGDFISVPANTKHWFDMGSSPNFKCIRFFGDEKGWVAEYTGDQIAESFPLIEGITQIHTGCSR